MNKKGYGKIVIGGVSLIVIIRFLILFFVDCDFIYSYR